MRRCQRLRYHLRELFAQSGVRDRGRVGLRFPDEVLSGFVVDRDGSFAHRRRFQPDAREVSDPEHEILNRLPSRVYANPAQQVRFQESQLLHPDRMIDQDGQAPGADLFWSGVGGHLVTDDFDPVTTDPLLDEFGRKAEALRDSVEDGGEGIEPGRRRHVPGILVHIPTEVNRGLS
jgi:hypothetical protein